MDTRWDLMLCQKVSTSGPMLKPSSLQKDKFDTSDIFYLNFITNCQNMGKFTDNDQFQIIEVF